MPLPKKIQSLLARSERADRAMKSMMSEFRVSQSSRDLQIGAEIRKLRESRDISLRDLARRIGFTAAYVSAMECGKSNINHEMAENIISAINQKTDI